MSTFCCGCYNLTTQNDLAGLRGFQYIVGTMQLNFTGTKAIIYAPMAGLSDSPSRRIARAFGADVTVSGLISSAGVVRNCRRTWDLAEFDNSERPIGLQIFGAEPASMARAAEALGAKSPDFIDINFGCPARKVVGGNGGSSVLRDMDQLRKIVKAVVDAATVPVTVKIRSGWDDNRQIHIDAGRIIEDCGAAAVTLHPRSKAQGFSGRADWNKIAELKQNVKIPVIGNGDIFRPEDAARMFSETGCDAIMVGRGAVGNPWLFGRIKRFLVNGEYQPEPKAGEKIELLIKHLESTIAFYGLPRAIFKMRGQYPWYLRGLPGNSEVKSSLNRISSPVEIKETLLAYRAALESEPLNAAVL